jgi:arylsulfatase A-like enzyme
VAAEVELIDIMPTVLAQTDVDAGVELQGDDLSPLISGDHWDSRPAFAEAAVKGGGVPLPAGVLKAVRIGDIKTIVNLTTDEALAFDLVSNPGEKPTIARSAGLPTDPGRIVIEEWLKINTDLGADFLPTMSDVDSKLIEQLEALGYVDQ